MLTYLKEKSEYEDRYDLWTIERCLKMVDFWNSKVPNPTLKDEEKNAASKIAKGVLGLQLYCAKGERYRMRDETIKKWMDEDRKLDEFYEKSTEPSNIRCAKCSSAMKGISKDYGLRWMGRPR